ncbi:hypothetical protein MVEN_02560400 [Mycena venus]|uniref:Uncharacterized protein n=1 Tax=Mycena venus TaxID=2733690 RepID=A0A8H6U3N8_9AGAR|nr:hypothetical protein MVEN_02560400 [Mycena venus]
MDVVIWVCTYEVGERILAEAAIHNRFIADGTLRVVRACLGVRCMVRHCEFFPLAKIGGLRAMDLKIHEVLARLCQSSVIRNFLPPPSGFEDLHRELRRQLMRR